MYSTKVRRIKSPLRNTFFTSAKVGKLWSQKMQGVHVLGKVTGGFVGTSKDSMDSCGTSLNLNSLSFKLLFCFEIFGSPQRFDQESLDNLHRSLKIQVGSKMRRLRVLHRWPRCCVYLIRQSDSINIPNIPWNFPICLFDIVNLNEFAICEFQLVAQLLATWVFLKATSIF